MSRFVGQPRYLGGLERTVWSRMVVELELGLEQQGDQVEQQRE